MLLCHLTRFGVGGGGQGVYIIIFNQFEQQGIFKNFRVKLTQAMLYSLSHPL